jgi:hypothetical protein
MGMEFVNLKVVIESVKLANMGGFTYEEYVVSHNINTLSRKHLKLNFNHLTF